MNVRSAFFAASAALVLLGTPRAFATPISFTGSGTNSLGNTISASATFDTSVAGHLTISLSNTYTTQIHAGGADVLTGLYFDIGAVQLTPMSALLGAGSSMLPNTANSSLIANNWAYFKTPGLVNGATAGDQAIAATGLISGSNVDFTGTSHGSSGFLAGPAYGLIGNANDSCGGLNHNTNNGLLPLEANTVVYQFSYQGSLSSISNVEFVYGTQAGEGSIAGHQPPSPPPPAPVPDGADTLGLLGAGLVALGVVSRRRAGLA